MFSPALYSNWERYIPTYVYTSTYLYLPIYRLMVFSGLENDKLFPLVSLSILVTLLTVIFNGYFSTEIGLFLIPPLLVALWGASLFQKDENGIAKGAGFNKIN